MFFAHFVWPLSDVVGSVAVYVKKDTGGDFCATPSAYDAVVRSDDPLRHAGAPVDVMGCGRTTGRWYLAVKSEAGINAVAHIQAAFEAQVRPGWYSVLGVF